MTGVYLGQNCLNTWPSSRKKILFLTWMRQCLFMQFLSLQRPLFRRLSLYLCIWSYMGSPGYTTALCHIRASQCVHLWHPHFLSLYNSDGTTSFGGSLILYAFEFKVLNSWYMDFHEQSTDFRHGDMNEIHTCTNYS